MARAAAAVRVSLRATGIGAHPAFKARRRQPCKEGREMASDKAKFPFMPGMAPGADPAHVGDMMQGMMRAQAKMMDAVLRQSIEALDFIKARYEKDRALYAALAAAGDAQASAKVWTDFMQRATSDYADEAGRLSALAAVTTEQVIEGVTEEVKAATGGAPRKGKA
ncbi:MAG: hypothetical protein CVT82_11855 [Alphaproteobacteria bacterium HGW-Alphaproteobacteria-4]|jgi:hypothetical protein|nr:MAG: hypothetical protein CVT82_11855 [Alphaproteobacteria bacterium HGW-Alphaproteobacteria-4]